MTREQAIKWLKTFRGRYGMNELEDAVEMAIKALEQTDVPDTNVGELIRRQAVLNLFAEKCDAVRPYHEVWQAVKELSPAEPDRKPGKWIHMVGFWECNQCHATYTDMPTCMGEALYGYCPMCGADMREAQGEM